MRTRPIRTLLSCAIVGALSLGFIASPATAKTTARTSPATDQVTFLAESQLPDGAIRAFPDFIEPYFANIASLGLLAEGSPRARTVVLRWMGWYITHLNNSDVSGLKGSIYDYNYDQATGVETPTNDYDSVDSYASTALNLAYRAYVSKDARLKKFVVKNIATYDEVAALLINSPANGGVRDANELTIAKPTYAVNYTMDNAEVVSGLRDYAHLKRLMHATDAGRYQKKAEATRKAMISLLWDTSTKTWDWALDSSSDPRATFYPEGVAQIWPTLWGVVSPRSAIAKTSWSTFVKAWPNWSSDQVPDAYPWTSMAIVARQMGDARGANRLVSRIRANYAPQWQLPRSCGASECGRWYSAEAGWMLLALKHQAP